MNHADNADNDVAFLEEIFLSLQGEGILIGEWQVFIRFRGCSFKCDSCDTKYAWDSSRDEVKIYRGSETLPLSNPVTTGHLNKILCDLENVTNLCERVVLTGGEPLEQVSFLKKWLPGIYRDYKVMLETGALLPEAGLSVRDYINFVSMDFKLASFTGSPVKGELHRRFYQVMNDVPGYIKLVVTPRTSLDEINHAGKIIRESKPNKPVVIQPVHEFQRDMNSKWLEIIKQMSLTLREHINEVRVIPQMSRTWNIP